MKLYHLKPQDMFYVDIILICETKSKRRSSIELSNNISERRCELKANERARILSDNTSGSSKMRVTGIIRNILYYVSWKRMREREYWRSERRSFFSVSHGRHISLHMAWIAILLEGFWKVQQLGCVPSFRKHFFCLWQKTANTCRMFAKIKLDLFCYKWYRCC